MSADQKIIRRGKIIVAVFVACILIMGIQGWLLWDRSQIQSRLTRALEVWHQCPMPPAGTVLIIEGEWPGKKAGEDYRCYHGIKHAPLRPAHTSARGLS